MLLDYCNTLLEFTSLALVFFIFSPSKPRWRNLLLYTAIVFTLSFYFVLDVPHLTYINIPLMLVSLIVSFYINGSFFSALPAASVSMLILFLEEWMFFALLPVNLLQTNMGNLLVTGAMVFANTGLLITSRYYKAEHYFPALLTRYWYILVILLLFFCFLGQSYLSRLSAYWQYLPGFVSLVLLCIFLIAAGIYVHYQHYKENMKSAYLLEMLASSDQFLTDIRVKNHDYKHHIQHIVDEVAVADDLSSLKRDIASYAVEVSSDRKIYDIILSIDSSVLRSSLYGFYQRCQKAGIQFFMNTTSLLPNFPLKDYELVEILQNLLANSFEYTNTLSDPHRWVIIELYADASLNRISVTNTLSDDITDIALFQKIGYTGKTNHEGLGLFSVNTLASSNGVRFLLDRNTEDHNITFSIEYEESPYV